MSRLTNGEGVPQVWVNPAATPIQTNVQPAPGQPLQGNALQQVAESLSVFNNGLMAWAQAKNTQINRQAAEAGAAVDFSQAFAKGDQLNKSFRQIVSEMKLPDSANPYFLAAAERNFGAYAAMKVRNGVLSRMAELANPDLDSTQQANLLNQIIAEESQKWGSQRFNGNFYATNAFNEGVASFFPEIERQANEQYLRNKETQALGDFESAVTEYLTIGKMDDAGSDQFSREIVAKMTGLQRFTTDPEKVRSAIFRSVVTAFQGAETEEEVANIMAAALDLPYGKDKTVADNMGLYAQLAAARERAEDDIERKADQEDRRFRRAAAAAVRSLGETGFDRGMVEDIQSGADTIESLNKRFDEWRQQNPDLPEAVADAVYQDKFALLAQLTQNQRAIKRGDSTAATNKIIGMIVNGSITDLTQAVAIATEFEVDAGPVVGFWDSFNSGAVRVQGKIPQQAIALAEVLAKTAEASGIPFNGFNTQLNITDEVTEAVTAFIEGRETLGGKTYQQHLSEGGRRAAEIATDQFLRTTLGEIKQRYEGEFSNRAATIGQERQGETPRLLDPSDAKTPTERKDLVEKIEQAVVAGFKPVYDAFTFNPTDRFTRQYSSPDAVANRIATMLSQEGPFEVGIRVSPDVVGGSPGSKRTIKSDGELYSVYHGGDQTRPIATFTRRQLLQYAVDLRMQPLSGIAVEDVLQDQTRVPGVSLSAFIAQQNGQRFPWETVPVFSSRKELDDMMNRRGYTDEQYGQFLNVILKGDLRPETVAAFRDRQILLLDNRDIYRNAAR